MNTLKFLKSQSAVLCVMLLTSVIQAQQVPVFIRPQNVGDVKIQYITVTFHTANVEDAGTDDDVHILMYNGMNPFYLNKPGDDLERNQTDSYIITDPNLKYIRDIKFITIRKPGSNGWAYDKVTISVNDRVLYSFGPSIVWMDKQTEGQAFSYSVLLSEQQIKSKFEESYRNLTDLHIVQPVLPRSTIKLMVESVVGNALMYPSGGTGNVNKSKCAAWGNTSGVNTVFGEAVEIAFRSATKLAIDLDLQKKENNAINPEYDVDIDLLLSSTTNGKISITPTSSWGAYKQCLGGTLISTNLRNLLSREFNAGKYAPFFNSNGDLVYYRLFR